MPIGRVAIEMTGQRVGRWTVGEKAHVGKYGLQFWWCTCDCGTVRAVKGSYLRDGRTNSCGCLRREQSSDRLKDHGLSKHRLFGTWSAMMSRCYNPKDAAYDRYGGRGIEVAKRWHDVKHFIADNDAKALEGLSIDRIDNDGNYSPKNTRWATRLQQSRNRKSNVYLTHEGLTMTLFEWAAKVGIAPRTLWARIKQSGWSVERALTEPVKH